MAGILINRNSYDYSLLLSKVKLNVKLTLSDDFGKDYFRGSKGSSYSDYHAIGRDVYNLTMKFLRKFIRLEKVDPSNNDILVIGCAYGYECKACKDLGFRRVVGIDISSHAISEAVKLFSNTGIEFYIGDVNDLSIFNENEFDIIMANNVLEHIPDPRKALKQLHRVSRKYVLLRLDNVFIIEIYNSLPKAIRKVISKIKGLPLELDTDLTHISQLPRYKWMQLLKSHGFKIKRILSITKLPVLLSGYHHYILEVQK